MQHNILKQVVNFFYRVQDGGCYERAEAGEGCVEGYTLCNYGEFYGECISGRCPCPPRQKPYFLLYFYKLYGKNWIILRLDEYGSEGKYCGAVGKYDEYCGEYDCDESLNLTCNMKTKKCECKFLEYL